METSARDGPTEAALIRKVKEMSKAVISKTNPARVLVFLILVLISFAPILRSPAYCAPSDGHNSVGTTSTSNTWYLAEGYTGGDFSEWILIQNPGATAANVAITYFIKGGEPQYYTYSVAANSRYTIPVDEIPGMSAVEVSAKIDSDQPVIAERSMYFGQAEEAGQASGTARIVIDLSDHRLYLYGGDQLVKTYPVAVGKASTPTPPAEWMIGEKYYGSVGMVTGTRKMRLFKRSGGGYAFTRYNIHGTNQPWLIGQSVSHGCIRMHNSDAEDLFPRVPIGTKVTTQS